MKLSVIVLSAFLAAALPVWAEEISVSGCAAAGVEASCMILKAEDGKTYDITAAQPAPAPGTYGKVTGTISDKMSICQQGPVIDPAQWQVEPGRECAVETSQ
jgi:hypothetical protein